MSTNKLLLWLQGSSLAVAVLMIAWGAIVLHRQAVTSWVSASAAVWMVLLLAAALWLLRGSFTALAATGLSSGGLGGLFRTPRIWGFWWGSGGGAPDPSFPGEEGA